ncbi:hypothetical protein MN202_04125 [Rheinheimera muenzenbergensis]|uniref:Uncharacterized protein n=1 Tax=Rheinheimera muenzenbergensis TaxID=1193628 RepID=A0ABU8C3B9_9GAMM
MLLRIYKAFVRGAHLTTQKNSPRFAQYFTSAQEGIFWGCVAIPISFFVAIKVLGDDKFIAPICFLLGAIVYASRRYVLPDKSDYYPERSSLSKAQIRKEVVIYNAITLFMISLNAFCIYLVVL